MIKKELYKIRDDSVTLYKTFSTKNHRIMQIETNEIFDEAIDVENALYTYKETDEMIEE